VLRQCLGSALGVCLGWAGLGWLPELACGCGGVGVDGGGGCWVLLGPLFLLCCSSAHANCMQLHVKGSCLLAAVSPVPGCSCMPLHLRQNWLSVPKRCGKMHRVLQMGWLTVSDRAKITHYTSILITEPVAACVIISQRSSRPLGAAMCGIAAGAAAHSPGMQRGVEQHCAASLSY
jgi:hypothetical protein